MIVCLDIELTAGCQPVTKSACRHHPQGLCQPHEAHCAGPRPQPAAGPLTCCICQPEAAGSAGCEQQHAEWLHADILAVDGRAGVPPAVPAASEQHKRDGK